MQAIYSDEHRYMDDGYGVKYETAAIHPSLLVTFSPWRGGRDHARIMEALPHSVPVGVLLRDRDGGEVRVGKDGNPVVKYRLSDYDIAHMRKGTDGAAQILEAAGAQQIFSSHSRLVSYEPGRNGGREQFIRDADACGWDAGPLHLRLLPHHGIGANGRLAGDIRLQSAGRDLGRARPVCLRRLRVPDRIGCQSDDLDRVDRAHERLGARRVAALT